MYLFTYLICFPGGPDDPSQFTSDEDTSRTLYVSWTPEFAGGLNQTFRLEAKKFGDYNFEPIEDGSNFLTIL